MLNLWIQKGKDAIKTLEFQQEIGGMYDYTKTIINTNRGSGKFSPNNNFFEYIWFRGTKPRRRQMEREYIIVGL